LVAETEWLAISEPEVQHLVEIAIIQVSIPGKADLEGPIKSWNWCYFTGPDGLKLELVEQR